jgi:YjjG family noncanonical pyrimidine nucleotidase
MLQNKNITDVFFDLDHTLWDFEKNSALAFEAVFEKQNIPIKIVDFMVFYVPVNLKYWEMYRKDEINPLELRLGRLKETFELLEFAIDDETIVFLSEQYIHYLPQYNFLFEGAIAVLDYLKPKYNLHIITNGFDTVQENKLNNSDIASYFKTVTNSEKAGAKKPNRIIFDYALDLAKAQKETSLMIGDSLEADVQGALDAGLDAIFFNENKEIVSENIKQVHYLLELKNYL